MRNGAAIIMGIVTFAFVVGAIVFALNHQRQTTRRDALIERGIEVPVEARTFLEQNTRRLNPNTGKFDHYSDDRVLFSLVVGDGREITVGQPIAEDRYDELGPTVSLTAVYLPEDPDGAELLDDGDFVANAVPYWLLALLCAACAAGSAASAFFAFRPKVAA